jgi:hypothetical protein
MLFDDLERRVAEKEAIQENSARLAVASGRFTSTGQGSVEFEKRVDFGLTFIERPFVSYGTVIDLDELGDLLDVPGGDSVPMPLVAGFVTSWDQDDRGFYVGAWCGARVYFAPTDLVAYDINPVIEHHFTFQAIALKDVPIDVSD